MGANPESPRRFGAVLPPPPKVALESALGVESLTVTWLAGDGSDRCYYRLTSPRLKSPLVLMQLSEHDADKLAEDGYDWIKIGRLLSARGIPVPALKLKLPEYAALIIEDYGDSMLETVVMPLAKEGLWSEVTSLYENAIGIIADFLGIPDDPVWTCRSFDAERYLWELNFFCTHYVEGHPRLALTAPQKAQLHQDCDALATFLTDYSRHFVHRDFHSRNIMCVGRNMAIIDFQDARLGPPTYDLVSLVFDSYVPLPDGLRAQLLKSGMETLRQHVPIAALQATWKPMLLQRQIKAIGTFGFLTNEKKRGNYLRYVKPALATVLASNVEDTRWPFLSGEFLSLLSEGAKDHD